MRIQNTPGGEGTHVGGGSLRRAAVESAPSVPDGRERRQRRTKSDKDPYRVTSRSECNDDAASDGSGEVEATATRRDGGRHFSNDALSSFNANCGGGRQKLIAELAKLHDTQHCDKEKLGPVETASATEKASPKKTKAESGTTGGNPE